MPRSSKIFIKGLFLLLAAAAVLAWASPGLAKKPNPDEKKAARLWSQIKGRLDQGRELEACRLARKMAPYGKTEAYARAKKTMLRRGISLETPLISWTSKAIVRTQNLVERDLIGTGDLKHIGALADHKDAWDTALRVEMVELGEYLYLVRSAGPDKKYLTGDDILIGGLKPKELKGQPADTGESKGHALSGSAGETETDQETQNREEVVELGDLLEKTD